MSASAERPGSPGRISIHSSLHLPGEFPQGGPLTPTTSAQLSLAQAVRARRAEYTTSRTLRIKVGSWNVAAFKDAEKDLGHWFVRGKGVSKALSGLSVHGQAGPRASTPESDGDERITETFEQQEARIDGQQSTVPKNDLGLLPGGEDVDIYALGLQEIVDLNSAFEAFRPYSDDKDPTKFKSALENKLPPGYQLVAEQQLVGLLLLVYVSPEIAPLIHSVSTTSVGTGLMGLMGNKGAVTARLVIGETTRLVFINTHMSAGSGKAELERRNWDAAQILTRTRFDPIVDNLGMVQELGEKIGDEDFAFVFGDLNYRLEGIPAEDVRRLLMLHTRNEYDLNQRRRIDKEIVSGASSSIQLDHPTTTPNEGSLAEFQSFENLERSSEEERSHQTLDPTSLQTTINSLMPHDELQQQQNAGRAFHDGWREGKITFLPTYKYDVGTVAMFDSGEKKRGPSWCDRILYRTRNDKIRHEQQTRLREEARVRDDQLKSSGVENAADVETTMFEYDPDADGIDEYDDFSDLSPTPSPAGGQQNEEETIALEYYTSHQRILSSDHKPLDAVFTIKYDATVPELKTKVQQDVARNLDRAENEGRPIITVVVDGGSDENDISFNGIDFGKVRYDEPKTRSITIANTGRAPAHFGFLQTPASSEVLRPSLAPQNWLSITFDTTSDDPRMARPHHGETSQETDDDWASDIPKVFSLLPGDTTSVDITSHVKDKEFVKSLNEGEGLEEILVLRVKDGRDHFLPVRGSWQASSYARTIDRLIRIPEGGVRALQGQKPEGSKSKDLPEGQLVMWSAPREIFRLTESIEALTERIVAEWSMLRSGTDIDSRPPWARFAGWPFVEESWTLDAEARQGLRLDVNEALDTDQPFDSLLTPTLPPLHRLEVMANVLLNFLRTLEDGVIPGSLWNMIERDFFNSKNRPKSRDEQKGAILEILSSSTSHSISFVLLMSMLGRIGQEIVNAVQGTQQTPRSNSDLPVSTKLHVKKRSLDKNPIVASKQLVNKNYAVVFGDILVRSHDDSGRSINLAKDRRRELVEIFLESGNG